MKVIVFVLAMLLTLPLGAVAQTTIVHSIGGHGAPFDQWLAQQAEVFQAQNPDIRIQFDQPTGNMVEAFLVRYAAGSAPDVTQFNDDLGGQLVARDVFLNLTPYFDRHAGLLDGILPMPREGFTWLDGSLWSFPIEVWPNMTTYNRDRLDQRGLVPPSRLGNDWTWERFAEYTRLLTEDTSGDGEADRWGSENPQFIWGQQTLIHQAGGRIVDRRKAPTQVFFNTPQVLTAMNFLHGLHQAGVFAPTPGRFITEGNQIGLLIAGAPGATVAQARARGEIPFTWGLAPPLRGPESTATLIALTGFQITRTSPNADAAWRWINFLAGSHEAQMEFAVQTGRIPARASATQMYPQAVGINQAMAEPIMQAVSSPSSYGNIQGGAIDVRPVNVSGWQRVLAGESPAAVFEDLQRTTQAALNEARAR